MTQIFKNIKLYVTFFLFLFYCVSCKKQDDFLDEKPLGSLSTINTLQDCQNLLSNESLFNHLSDPQIGELTTDDYYLTTALWNSLAAYAQNIYVFAKDIYPVSDDILNEWNKSYNEVYVANTVLDALPTLSIKKNDTSAYNTVEGTALFYRAIAFYNLVQTYALPYDSTTAGTDPGIVLRLSSSLTEKSVRATEKQCYNQIISDLNTCLNLLPGQTQYTTEPNKTAANALLARIYLALGDYNEAYQYADQTLTLNNQLFDYNKIVSDSSGFEFAAASQYPLPEVIYTSSFNVNVSQWTVMIVDSTLLASYDNTDLRKSLFFLTYGGYRRFIGSYEFKTGDWFSGIATDEIYLIRAECEARGEGGGVSSAMADLNTLLKNRYKTGTYVPHTAANSDDALRQVLAERRKELLYRGLRWTDLRRLNKDSRFATTIVRVINGTTYTLPPNDPRYAMPLPLSEIQLSGVAQNPR